MFTRTAVFLLALGAIAGAQAPTPPPPKPKVISMPKKAVVAKPKTKPKPKPTPKPAADAADEPGLPAAEPTTLPVADAPAVPPAPAKAEQPKRSRAVETSLSAYMPKVKATLGKGWAASLQARAAEFQPGNVSVSFKVDDAGKVVAVKTTENSSNPAFEKFCEDYVRGIQFDPPPSKSLEDGTLEIPFTFWLY
jgi:periplasmic protein TonB